MAQTKMQIEDWLDDLCVRFIINLPREELESVERICFQVEEAQWFYEDFIRPLDPTLPSMSLRSFCLRIFQHCPLLSAFSHDHHVAAFSEFLAYKTRVPVRGAIMLNHAMDQVVLVKGWKKGANWSFPRGKINKEEKDFDCALREVHEETGFDIKEAGLLKDDIEFSFIEVAMREQNIRLYVFRDVPMDTQFQPRTRKEISKIQWHRLADLPTLRKSKHQSQSRAEGELLGNANKFYMVAPFLVPLKKWIAEQRRSSVPKVEAPKDIAAELGTETIVNAQDSESEVQTEAVPHEIPDAQNSIENVIEDASTQLKRLLSVQMSPTPAQPVHYKSEQTPQFQEGSNALLALLRNGAPQIQGQDIKPAESLLTPQVIPLASEESHREAPLPLPFANVSSHAVSKHSESSLHVNQPATQLPPQQIPTIPVRLSSSMASFQQLHESTTPNKLGFSTHNGPVVETRPDSQVHSTPYGLQHSGRVPMSSQLHQFASAVPSASQLPPPKLTTHSLNLLNVFKNGQMSKTAAQPVVGEASDSHRVKQSIAVEAEPTKIDGLPLRQNITLTQHAQPIPTHPPPQPNHGSGHQPADQKKALLSLFTKSSPETTTPTSRHPPSSSTTPRLDERLSAVRADILSQVSSRQQRQQQQSTSHSGIVDMNNTTTTTSVSPARTPRSSADREFLLGYLKGVAKG